MNFHKIFFYLYIQRLRFDILQGNLLNSEIFNLRKLIKFREIQNFHWRINRIMLKIVFDFDTRI